MSMMLYHSMLSNRRRLEEIEKVQDAKKHESETTIETNKKKLVNVGSICWGNSSSKGK